MLENVTYDLVVVGGGPSGATAAHDAAKAGYHVALLDRAGRIKPCGGAIPPRCVRDFDIPPEMLVARVFSARIISPSDRKVDMPIPNSYVGMVDREHFDEWLRERAAEAGADRRTGTYESLTRDGYGTAIVNYTEKDGTPGILRARCVIGADGAFSKVARDTVRGLGEDALCLRLSRDHQVARERHGRIRAGPLRRLLPGHAVARFLCLGLSAWRDDQRRHGQRQQGLLAQGLGRRTPQGRRASTARRSAARVRPFR